MRVTKRSLKGREGEIAVTAETLDDLWHLKYIIEKGDLVFAVTKRKADTASDKIRPEKVEKVKVDWGSGLRRSSFISLQTAEDTRDDRARNGRDSITPQCRDGTIFHYQEHWKNDSQRILDAEEASKRPKVVVAAVEEGMRYRFVHHYGTETSPYPAVFRKTGNELETSFSGNIEQLVRFLRTHL
jgi:protein pelota